MSEQFRSDYLDRLGSEMVPGGFQRLKNDGAFYPDCRLACSTFTASGLATLVTGAYPENHGIVADRWYDRAGHEVVPAAPDLLEATSLADQIPQDPSYRVFAVGVDSSHTAFVAGTVPTSAFTFDSGGQFVCRGTEPEWFQGYREARPLENLRNASWMALGAKPGAPPLRVLKYDSAKPEEFAGLYKSSPFAQAAIFELARELITREALGQGDTHDILVLVLGSMALLGYEVGADSPLMQQMVLHLDRQIEFTLETLDKTVERGNYDLVFTAAHGAPPAPDPNLRSRFAIPGEEVARAVNLGLSKRFDVSSVKNVYVDRYVYPFLYLSHPQLRRYEIDPAKARVIAGQIAMQVPGVFGYYTADGESSHRGDWIRRFRNSFNANRSGDVMLTYGPGYVEEFGAGRGVSYGSFYNYDARVPLFLFGSQFRARVFEDTIEAVDIAPTLASAGGWAFPSSATGRVLGEAFARVGKKKQ